MGISILKEERESWKQPTFLNLNKVFNCLDGEEKNVNFKEMLTSKMHGLIQSCAIHLLHQQHWKLGVNAAEKAISVIVYGGLG